jgi:hypothetical protein
MSILSGIMKKGGVADGTRNRSANGGRGPVPGIIQMVANKKGVNISGSRKQTDTDAGGLGGVQRQITSAFSLGSQLPGDNAEAEEGRTGRRMSRSISDTIRNQRISSRFGSGFGRGAF